MKNKYIGMFILLAIILECLWLYFLASNPEITLGITLILLTIAVTSDIKRLFAANNIITPSK